MTQSPLSNDSPNAPSTGLRVAAVVLLAIPVGTSLVGSVAAGILAPGMFLTGLVPMPPWSEFRVSLAIYLAVAVAMLIRAAFYAVAALQAYRGRGWWLAVAGAVGAAVCCVSWVDVVVGLALAVVLALPGTRGGFVPPKSDEATAA